jgi:5-methylcytosine-specific restriction endonuclease McrA
MSKKPRLKLDPLAYRRLLHQVLERDGWRCQCCGSMTGLQSHHLQFRSHAGDDDERNLITLCYACHQVLHNAKPSIGV